MSLEQDKSLVLSLDEGQRNELLTNLRLVLPEASTRADFGSVGLICYGVGSADARRELCEQMEEVIIKLNGLKTRFDESETEIIEMIGELRTAIIDTMQILTMADLSDYAERYPELKAMFTRGLNLVVLCEGIVDQVKRIN